MAKKSTSGKKSKNTNGSTNGNGHSEAGLAEAMKSKTRVAREYIQSNPSAANKDVLAALQSQLPKLTYADVANARSILNKNAGKKSGKRNGKAAPSGGPSPSKSNGIRPSGGAGFVEAATKAMDFAGAVGGIDEAIELLTVLKRIQSL